MRRISIILFIIAALTASSLTFAQTTGDRDGDGVGDSRDRCPDVAGPTELMGCPPDADGDGTFDFEDACPNDGGPAQNRGCPVLPDPTPVPDTTPAAPPVNPNLPLASGPCTASTYLQVNVNARNYPGASGEIVAQLDPNILYPVLGLVALPDEEETYLAIELENVLISSYSISPTSTPMAFDPAFLGGVFVAASTMNVGGDCGPEPVALLLPAVQKVREAAARMSSSATDDETGIHGKGITVRKAGGRGEDYYKVTMSDLLISSFQTGRTGGGKVSLQDFHFVVGTDGYIVAKLIDGELVFDWSEEEPAEAADYFLKLRLTDSEEDPQPIVLGVFWLLKKLGDLVAASGEGIDDPGGTDNGGVGEEQPDSDEDGDGTTGGAAFCEQQFLDQLAALGAEVGVIPTDYGIDFVATLPSGVQPPTFEPCGAGDGSVIPTDQVSLNFTKIEWVALGDGSVRTSLAKVGPGTLVLGNVGVSEDGAVCVDLQPAGSQPLCVPNALPAVQ